MTNDPSRSRRSSARAALGFTGVSLLSLVAPGCLDRPVAPQQPLVTSSQVQQYKNQRIDKVDLLFMIDNSASMADKQSILAEAVPAMVKRLTNPPCMNKDGTKQEVAPHAECPDGYEREFEPVENLHIGVLSSSLGGYGSGSCPDNTAGQNDRAHLIGGRDASGFPTSEGTFESKGFLSWNPAKDADSATVTTALTAFNTKFADVVKSVDQKGCGFEMSLESWYRFLIDPMPYKEIDSVPCNGGDTGKNCRAPKTEDGKVIVDDVILNQRRDFLRPDSLVAIIMLSDENDCSVALGGQNHLVLQQTQGAVPRGTSECDSDPWAPECKSCWQDGSDPACKNPGEFQDTVNLRCFEQKRRFGINFLHAINRYVNGLREQKFSDGTLNPLFCPKTVDGDPMKCTTPLRDTELVFLAGIVGVPWQDIANDPTTLDKGYRPTEQLSWTPQQFTDQNVTPPSGLPEGKTLWNVILGEVSENHEIMPTVDPLDPFMKESIAARSGANPITGDAITPPKGTPNRINGTEYTEAKKADLQYACTFPLPDNGKIDCTQGANKLGCDCQDKDNDKPLCDPTNRTQQIGAKAYPGRRQLAVLKGVGSQGVVASVCPSETNDDTSPSYGYNPALNAITDRLKGALQGTCWRQDVEYHEDGTVECAVFDAYKANGECPPCEAPFVEASPSSVKAVTSQAEAVTAGLNCVCQVPQAEPGVPLDTCVSAERVTTVSGWCYVSPADNPKSRAELVLGCPADSKRLIRFVPDGLIPPDHLVYLQCKGAQQK